MKISFSELSEHGFVISDIFAVRQLSDKKTTIDMCSSPRTTDALLLFTSGTAICYQEGEPPLFVPQGTLMYMPYGSRYTWEISPASEGKGQERLLFEFRLYRTEICRGALPKRALTPLFTQENLSFSDRVISLGSRNFSVYQSLFQNLIARFSLERNCYFEVNHAAMEIFYQIARDWRSEERDRLEFSLIEAGIRHLENDLSFDKSIREIAGKCNVSVRYFEKLFKRYAGISPKEYADARRVYRIKTLLNQNQMPLKEIAQHLSFCDCAYLCRFFKNKTGMTPDEYRKRHR